MHKLPNNLKKIRNVKNLSQKSFAAIFDLKRATLGAYEEARSEPRIDTLIKIANYFSITLDQLLCKELTVNELLHFEDHHFSDKSISTALSPKVSIANHEVLWVEASQMSLYATKCHLVDFTNTLSKYVFPDELLVLLFIQSHIIRAFTVVNLEMSYAKEGLFTGDIVLAYSCTIADFLSDFIDEYAVKSKYQDDIFVVVTQDQTYIRKIKLENTQELICYSIHPYVDDKVVAIDNIKELWKITHKISSKL